MNLIFLVGMPAAGKTYWGRAWADQHRWSFADLDEHIEVLAGVSIEQIFASTGEDGFRAIERHVLEQIISGARGVKTIIATGGGTPCFEDNLELMQQSGCVIYLSARPKTILAHLKSSSAVRPLLAGHSLASLDELLETRRGFYEQAAQTVAVEKIDAGTFAKIITACTNRHL